MASSLRQRSFKAELQEPLLGVHDGDTGSTTGRDAGKDQFGKDVGCVSVVGACLQFMVDMVRKLPFFTKPTPPVELSDRQYKRLQDLWDRIRVPYDSSNEEHQEGLRWLWALVFPGKILPSMKTPLWKDMGWQGEDPATDFRSGGLISLQHLTFMGEKYPSTFKKLLHKHDGVRSEWEYPFAVAGLNVTFMLTEVLELRNEPDVPNGAAFRGFAKMLEHDEDALALVYVATYELLDFNWLKQKASYMEFPGVMSATRSCIAEALASQQFSKGADFLEYIRFKALA